MLEAGSTTISLVHLTLSITTTTFRQISRSACIARSIIIIISEDLCLAIADHERTMQHPSIASLNAGSSSEPERTTASVYLLDTHVLYLPLIGE
jgi:hypothetical protein